MRKRILYTFLLLTVFQQITHGQAKIGDNPLSINTNAVLEVESATKGFLMPRLSLSATNSFAPLAAFVEGMIVYNTATTGSGPYAVTKGIYYCDGTQWIKSNNTSGWSLTGNVGTDSTLNFLGTIDNRPLVFKTSNSEALRITSNGNMGIGTTTPAAKLDVNGAARIANVPNGIAGTDSLLVLGSTDHIVKKIPVSSFALTILKSRTLAYNGQTIFTTPATISNIDRISLFRNGVLISFTINSSNSIVSEIACYADDEIRIIQTL